MQHKIQSVIGVVFSPDKTGVLLVERDDIPVWVLPGGGVDEGERPEDAIIREILEETGFTVKIKRLVGVYLPANRLTKVTHLYECTILEGKETPSQETRKVQFHPRNKLPYLLPPPFPEWIKDASQDAPLIHKTLHSVNYRALFFYLFKHPILVLRFVFKKLF
jgi:ADP-ribose pyrophosphatase YjhB (NUDIX family)